MEELLSAYCGDEDREEATRQEEEEEEEPEAASKRKRREEISTLSPSSAAQQLPPLKRQTRSKNREGSAKNAVPLPPLPSDLFGDLQAKAEAQRLAEANERERHGGRSRQFAHVEGNYPTFVYVPVDLSRRDTSLLRRLVEALISRCERWLQSLGRDFVSYPLSSSCSSCSSSSSPSSSAAAASIPVQQQHHISLSRTFALRQHHIEPFVALLRSIVQRKGRGEGGFWIGFQHHDTLFPPQHEEEEGEEDKEDREEADGCVGEYELFVNDEATRSFASLRVTDGKEQLCNVISLVDEALAQFNLPLFYPDPRPHMTVGWTLGNVLPELPVAKEGILRAETDKTNGEEEDEGRLMSIYVDKIYCITGKQVHVIPLF
ncbi:hypothetical protein QOT17_023173 [Balamuthia mandrillaris]